MVREYTQTYWIAGAKVKIVVDTNILIQIIKKGGRNDLHCPRTKEKISSPEARAEALVDLLTSRKDQIIIPAPAFSEVLVRIEHKLHTEYQKTLNHAACFTLQAFDDLSAIECARLVNDQEIKQISPHEDKKKISFDRQIIAICKAYSADELWTHDCDMLKKAEAIGITVKSLSDIEPKMTQLELVDAAG